MAYSRYAEEYKKNAVSGASPLQLVVMLYDGAMRQMESGRAAMARGEIDKQNAALQKAQRIVMELMSALDMDNGGEMAQNLLALYTFVLEQLVEANVYDDAGKIDVALRTMSELRDGWATLERDLQQPPDLKLAA